MNKLRLILGTLIVFVIAIIFISTNGSSTKSGTSQNTVPTEIVKLRSFPINVSAVGELEAARSISLSSSIRNDQAKVIFLVADGIHVDTGDLLVRIDATPFEKAIEKLHSTIVERENQVYNLEQSLEWEEEQSKHEAKAIEYELQSAQLELNKIVQGDGPLEEARLKSAMQKSKIKYEELNSFSDELQELQKQGFLNPAELKQAEKKLQDEQDAYESAKMQYESFVEYVHPMQLKKAETTYKKLIAKQEETLRSSQYKISKAKASLQQSKQELEDTKRQLKEAQHELSLTELKAPSPGMVVLREEYRSSQKRKPRIGDVLVRNQPILDLPDLNSMIVKTRVREIDLYKIDIGKPTLIEVDAYPNLLFEGKVIFIGVLALTDLMISGDEKYFEVKIGIEKTDPRLRPGMTSRITILADNVENGLTVPIHAVFENNKKHFCYVKEDKGYSMRPVTLGMNNEQWVEITSGLKDGEKICLASPPEVTQLKEGKHTQSDDHAKPL